MSNPSEAKCPRCAAPLPPIAPEGLCPRCLGALNLLEDTALTGVPPTPAQPPLTPAELAPHFPQLEIIECLGRGGMGVVYKARQKSLNRVVALKLLAPERVTDAGFAERFTREAQALAALNHPNIVTIHDFGATTSPDSQLPASSFFYLLMEFVDGVNLRQAMKAGRFTPEQALAIVPPVCEALQYAHEHGIVHRDIKPENLLLDKAGRIKIADFGIAKILEPGRAELPLGQLEEAAQQRGPTTPESFTAGTPGYMAPEQKSTPQRVDSRADIYSLGVVFYEMLTGELPADKLQPPSRKVQIDVRLDEIVLRALEQKPELRFQTAADFRTQVETIAEGAAASPDAAKSDYVTSWGFRITTGPAVKTGYVRFWERRFGSVESSGAINTLNLSRIGFIGCLALFAIIPGWRWCWPAFGFLGMFVGIGAAYLSEAAARRGVDLSKTRGLPAEQSQRVVWRRRIVWLAIGGGVLPMAFFAFALLLSLGRNGEKVIEAATTGQMAFVFAKIFAIGSGLTLLIWALLRAFWRKAANAANPWLQHPEALVALTMFWPLLLMTAPFVILEFVSAHRPPSARMNAAEWIMWGLVVFFFVQGAVWFTRKLREVMREANGQCASPGPELPKQPRWQGWDVWVIGLCLATFGGLWLERLSSERLQQSLHDGPIDASDIVLRTALATVILLAGAAFLWMLAKNIKTASGSRAISWKRQLGRSIVPTIAVVVLLRTFIMQPFWAVSDATAPEIPRGSLVLVWKPTRTFTAGEVIAYIEKGRVNLGRIDKPSQDAVFVKRNDSEPTSVLHADIVGKVMSVLWRATDGSPPELRFQLPDWRTDGEVQTGSIESSRAARARNSRLVLLALGLTLLAGLVGLFAALARARRQGVKPWLVGALLVGGLLALLGTVALVTLVWSSQGGGRIEQMQVEAFVPPSPPPSPNTTVREVMNGLNLKLPRGQVAAFSVVLPNENGTWRAIPALAALVASSRDSDTQVQLHWRIKRSSESPHLEQGPRWSVRAVVPFDFASSDRPEHGTNFVPQQVLNWWQSELPVAVSLKPGQVHDFVLFRAIGPVGSSTIPQPVARLRVQCQQTASVRGLPDGTRRIELGPSAHEWMAKLPEPKAHTPGVAATPSPESTR